MNALGGIIGLLIILVGIGGLYLSISRYFERVTDEMVNDLKNDMEDLF